MFEPEFSSLDEIAARRRCDLRLNKHPFNLFLSERNRSLSTGQYGRVPNTFNCHIGPLVSVVIDLYSHPCF